MLRSNRDLRRTSSSPESVYDRNMTQSGYGRALYDPGPPYISDDLDAPPTQSYDIVRPGDVGRIMWGKLKLEGRDWLSLRRNTPASTLFYMKVFVRPHLHPIHACLITKRFHKRKNFIHASRQRMTKKTTTQLCRTNNPKTSSQTQTHLVIFSIVNIK